MWTPDTCDKFWAAVRARADKSIPTSDEVVAYAKQLKLSPAVLLALKQAYPAAFVPSTSTETTITRFLAGVRQVVIQDAKAQWEGGV